MKMQTDLLQIHKDNLEAQRRRDVEVEVARRAWEERMQRSPQPAAPDVVRPDLAMLARFRLSDTRRKTTKVVKIRNYACNL